MGMAFLGGVVVGATLHYVYERWREWRLWVGKP